MAVFIHNQGGLMADLSINGQNMSFVPADQADQDYWSRNGDRSNTTSYQSTSNGNSTYSESTTTTR